MSQKNMSQKNMSLSEIMNKIIVYMNEKLRSDIQNMKKEVADIETYI